MCTHNGESFVARQLESIASQSVLPDEIVISDDASTDGTVAIMRSVIEANPALKSRVRLNIHAQALGVAGNFETAIRATRGDLVVLCDQDDVWLTNRIEDASNAFLVRPQLDFLFSNAHIIDAEGNRLPKSLLTLLEVSLSDQLEIHRGHGFTLFMRRNFATGATVMFRRSLLGFALPFPSGWIHDEWLATVAAVSGQIDIIEDELIEYRQHGSNQIGVTEPTLWRKVKRTLEKRAGRNDRLSRIYSSLAARCVEKADQIIPRRLEHVLEKARFEAERADLSASRLRRLKPVAQMAFRGKYVQYSSQGRLDMVRDLLQPH